VLRRVTPDVNVNEIVIAVAVVGTLKSLKVKVVNAQHCHVTLWHGQVGPAVQVDGVRGQAVPGRTLHHTCATRQKKTTWFPLFS
jgi:hypothetical protein